ncbi:hypothetical protein ACLFMI_17765 [Pseudonocardia nantongensis]|uniref:hypothetical protein n=1 Tax=Pseudonocardia nantongensis TaxID=1181885 RepID=UPI00397D409B
MTVVRLLGPPGVTGAPVTRGRKPWALLALLLCSTGPVPRTRVVELLFPDADDPGAALRWTLSRARRATGGAVVLGGDPLRAVPAEGVTVDVLDVLAGRDPGGWPLAEATLPLLEGCEPDVPGFVAWLHGRRRDLASAGARLQRSRRARPCSPAGRGAVRELILVGERVMDAGAARDGTRVLAGAVRRARVLDDDAVLAGALAHYGRGIVHAVASTDPGAAAALREADRLATREGLADVAALARRELGFVATATGDQPGALAELGRATVAAAGRPGDEAGVAHVRGFALVDTPGSAGAPAELTRAVELAETADRPRAAAAALAIRARALLQRDDEVGAEADLARARGLVAEQRWTAMRPWVDALHGELLLRAGHTAEAEAVLADALTLAEVLDDACWIALTARGLAAARAARGDPVGAAGALRAACHILVADADVCCWIELHLRDTLCTVTARYDPAGAIAESRTLAARAARVGLEEYEVRAVRHRARLGDAEAALEQRARAERLDNPALLRT